MVSFCYVLLNFVFLYTVPMSELTGRLDIGYLSARSVFGETGGRIITLLVCLALISSMSSMIMVGPRIAQTMGEDFMITKRLAKRNSRGSPVYAMLFQSSLAALLAVTSTFVVRALIEWRSKIEAQIRPAMPLNKGGKFGRGQRHTMRPGTQERAYGCS